MSEENQVLQKPEENKMGVMPVRKLLFSMAVPMMVSMLFQALYNIVDSIFVSKLNQDAMNAVSLSFPIQTLLIAFSTGTGVGMNALLSRSLGEKKYKRANRTANTGIFLYLCMAVLFSVIGWGFGRKYFEIQTSNPAIIAYGGDYLHICIGIGFFLFGQMCFERLLQSTGRTDLAMIPQVVGAVTNMILDPVFIFGLLGAPRLEVMGAAVATVIGQGLATLVGLYLNLKKNKEIRLSVREIRPNRKIIAMIYKIGLPSILMQSIGSVMNFFMNQILIGFTEAATAVFGAYYKLQSFIFMPIFGLNNAMIPIISYNYGAGKPDRVKKVFKLTVLTAVTIMSVGTLLFETIPGILIGIFSPSDEMLSIGRTALRIIGSHFPLAGFSIIAVSVCQAIGNPFHSLINSVCRQLVVLLPAAYLLSLTGKLNLVWLAFPIAEIFSIILSFFFLRSTFRKLADLNAG